MACITRIALVWALCGTAVARPPDWQPATTGEGFSAEQGRMLIPREGVVTRTLDPRLALYLPKLAGIVSETGSVLSHLAILAREFHVPTVVAVDDALDRFPVDAVLVVDGDTGEVDRVSDQEEATDADQ